MFVCVSDQSRKMWRDKTRVSLVARHSHTHTHTRSPKSEWRQIGVSFEERCGEKGCEQVLQLKWACLAREAGVRSALAHTACAAYQCIGALVLRFLPDSLSLPLSFLSFFLTFATGLSLAAAAAAAAGDATFTRARTHTHSLSLSQLSSFFRSKQVSTLFSELLTYTGRQGNDELWGDKRR